jgi:hypothetical protein
MELPVISVLSALSFPCGCHEHPLVVRTAECDYLQAILSTCLRFLSVIAQLAQIFERSCKYEVSHPFCILTGSFRY